VADWQEIASGKQTPAVDSFTGLIEPGRRYRLSFEFATVPESYIDAVISVLRGATSALSVTIERDGHTVHLMFQGGA